MRPRWPALACLVLIAGPAAAQAPPRLNGVFPAGARAGTAVTVTFTGADLDGVSGVRFARPGLSATLAAAPVPDPKAKPKKGMNAPANPGSAAAVVTVAADVPPGQYDVRLVSARGVSNPRRFTVSDRPEVNEQEPNDDAVRPEPDAALGGSLTGVPRPGQPRAQRVALGTVVNGVISSPTDVDYTVFAGKQGARVLAHCQVGEARARPAVEVFTTDGRRLGANRNYAGSDALCDVTLPADGDYFVRVSEFAYVQGGPDSTYRLTIDAMPWVDAVHPPAVPARGPSRVTLLGRNLPGGRPVPGLEIDGRPVEALEVTVTPPTDPAARTRFEFAGTVAPTASLGDGFTFRLPGANPVVIGLTDATPAVEPAAANDTPDTATPVPAPGEVAGRIDRRNDRDWYSFPAAAGDRFVVELVGDRAGSVADFGLRVVTESGKELAGEVDDDNDPLHPVAFPSRSSDPPAVAVTAAEAGRVRVLVTALDAAVSFGPRANYRLIVRRPAPDFRAVAMPRLRDKPGALTLAPGGTTAIDVFVHRRDAFTAPVTLTVGGLPDGVTAAPALVGTGCRYGTVVLTAAKTAAVFTGALTVTANATIDGATVTRVARPAGLVWPASGQADAPAFARLEDELVLAVRPGGPVVTVAANPAGVLGSAKSGNTKPVRDGSTLVVKPGAQFSVPVTVGAPATATLTAEAVTPGGPNAAPFAVNNNQPLPASLSTATLVLVDVRPTAAPGTYALTLRAAVGGATPRKKGEAPPATGYAAPLTVVVLPDAAGKLTATADGRLKPGGTVAVTVKLQRSPAVPGLVRVTLALPDGRGLKAEPATIPAGADTAQITVTAAADAKPGPAAVTVAATATVHERFPVTAEAKLNLVVGK